MSNSNLTPFHWKGKNQFGQVLKGRLMAQSSAALISLLKQHGISSCHIRPVYTLAFFVEKTKKVCQPLFRPDKKTIRLEIAFMLRQLSMLLSANVPLMQAFEVMESHRQNVSFVVRKILFDSRVHIQKGHTLSQAFSQHPKYFSAFFCRWIEAGEYSGTLDVLLEHWISYQEKNEQIRQKIKKALTYPLFILITAIIIAAILLIGVMPIFEKLFHQMGAELPTLTRYVIKSADVFKTVGIPFLLFLSASMSILWHRRERLPRLAFWLDKIILKIPLTGKIIQEVAMVRFSRTLSILLSAGFPLSEALQWTAKVMNNRFLTQIVLHCQTTVVSGTALSHSLSKSKVFSSLLKQMIAVGEASGTLDKTLAHTADFYEKTVSHTLDKMTLLIEPTIMVILGTMAGVFILAMYLPIFKLGALF